MCSAAAALALVLLVPSPGAACTCAPASVPEAIDAASAVFTGRVERIELLREPRAFRVARVQIRVMRRWKGPETARITVFTSASTAACGYPFRVGGDYLVLAHRRGDGRPLSTGLCTRTVELDDAGEELAHLGRGERPGTPASMPPAGVPLPDSGGPDGGRMSPAGSPRLGAGSQAAPTRWTWLGIGGAAGLVLGAGLTAANLLYRRKSSGGEAA